MSLTKVTFDLVNLAYIAGYLLVIYGLLALFFPKALIRINNYVNKMLANIDKRTTKHRVITGFTTVIVGGAILFTLFLYL